MDDIDRKLLASLQEYATTPMADLTAHVGLSATPVWKRIQKMDRSGVITRRVACSTPELVGIGLIVSVAIEAHEHTPDWLVSFAAVMAGMPEVRDATEWPVGNEDRHGLASYAPAVRTPRRAALFALPCRLI